MAQSGVSPSRSEISAETAVCLVEISLADQTLRFSADGICRTYSVSTALNGAGERQNSGQTPRGWHRIQACIGSDQPLNAVFVGRRPTGEIYSADLAAQFPQRDWILTRVLWLQGLEIGVNRMGQVDSMRRYIYIHGTPDTEPVGQACSHGCIRMRNEDICELFALVQPGTPVWIQEHSLSRIPCRNL